MNEGAVGKLKIEERHSVVGFVSCVMTELINAVLWLAVLHPECVLRRTEERLSVLSGYFTSISAPHLWHDSL